MISDGNYNAARDILIAKGSKTAEKSHRKHTGGKGSSDDHGKSLLQEARDEFRGSTLVSANPRSGMSPEQYEAIHSAARKMGLSNW